MLQAISRPKTDTKAYIALGSNVAGTLLGPFDAVREAFWAVQTDVVRLERASGIFSTPCVPAGAGPDYVNAVAVLGTDLDAEGLLAHLHAVEARFERQRVERWGARTLDLDLLDFGGQVAPDRATWDHWYALPFARQKVDQPDQLILPHPRLAERAFVLVPLAEIAPDWRHPVLGQTAADLCAQLTDEDLAGIRCLEQSESLALPAKDR